MNISPSLHSARTRTTRSSSSIPSLYYGANSTKVESLVHNTDANSRSITLIKGSRPILSSKYKKVWQRVRTKLKATMIMRKLHEQQNLYGVNSAKFITQTHSLTDETELFKRASRILEKTNTGSTTDNAPRCIIHPDCKFKKLWNWIIIVILLYTAIFTPFSISFIDNYYLSIYALDLIVNFIFFSDFCLSFFSAYYDARHALVTDHAEIVKNYAKGWMLIDLLTWIPFDTIQDSNFGRSNALARFLRLPKLYRLLRISKLLKMTKSSSQLEILDKIQDFLSIKNMAFKIIKSYITIFIFVHIISCLWYLSAKLYDFSPQTWVVRGGYQDLDIGSLYLTSLYWAITTLVTVGYGDIVPLTTLEISLAMVWMATGLYFFSFNISSLTSLICSIDLKDNALGTKLAMIEEFSAEANLPKSLRAKIKASLNYTAEKRGFSRVEKMSILDELPKLLRYEVVLAMHHGAATYLKFFINKDQAFVSLIVPMLEPMYVEKDTSIYYPGDAAEDIYFLTNGFVTLYHGRNLIIKNLMKGKHFGDIETVKQIRRKLEAFVDTFSEILVMNGRVISQIQKLYPSVWDHIHSHALKREKKYERIIVHLHEMEKFNQGDIDFEDFEQEFPYHVQRVVQERLSAARKELREVTLSDIVKKIDQLIKQVNKKRTI